MRRDKMPAVTQTAKRKPTHIVAVPDCEKSLVAAAYDELQNDPAAAKAALAGLDVEWLTIPAAADALASIMACAELEAPHVADVQSHIRKRQKVIGKVGVDAASSLFADCVKAVIASPQAYRLGLRRYAHEVEAAYRQRVTVDQAADIVAKAAAGALDVGDVDALSQNVGRLRASLTSREESPAATPAWQPFPVQLMPPAVRDYVAQTADGMACDATLVALPILAGLAAAIGNTRTISLNDEWAEPSILWVAVVADSGSLKTPASRKALRFITQQESDIEQRNAAARDEYEQELVVHESRMAAWKHQARRSGDNAGAPPLKPARPPRAAYVVSDTTIEAVVGILADNPRGVLLERDELAGWLGGFDKYKAGGASRVSSEVGHWLSMHNAGTLRLDRKSTGRTFVERASLSITGGIQPDTLTQAIGQEHVANGLLARFLLAAPPRRPKRFTTATADFAAVESARQLFSTLYGLPMPEDGPKALRLSRDGLAAWEPFFQRHADRQMEAKGVEASMLAKIEAAAARLALIHHVCRQAGGEPTLPHDVDAQSVEVGIALAEWFADEWLRVYEATIGGSPKSDHDAELLAWIDAQGGKVPVRDIGQRLRRYRDADVLERTITALVHAGRLTSFTVKNDQGGPPAHWVRLVTDKPKPR